MISLCSDIRLINRKKYYNREYKEKDLVLKLIVLGIIPFKSFSSFVMKKVKVSIQDENTLVLLEDAFQGDLIDLKSIHETDIDTTTITSVVRSIKQDKLQEVVKKETERIEEKFAYELNKKEMEWKDIEQKKLQEKEKEINELKSQSSRAEVEKKLAITEAIQKVEKERDNLANGLKTKELEKQNLENFLKQQFSTELQNKDVIIKYKDEEIARVKDMKQKLSTKMLGETLEIHCENEFNKLRATAFQKAYFEKDNDSKTGSKGDFIYKENDDDGNEIISIMFEMKNESDETATKKRNEDFFRELDKDRNEKKCEYAVLVSLLEAESEYYNSGIVDVSHKYPKMYVIRPQFFIPIITLLRNAAMNSMKYKSELAMVRAQNIDVTNFEDQLNEFRDGFDRNYRLHSDKFNTAIESIDKAIIQLQKTKEYLQWSENNLRIANNKLEDLSIKKLTRGNPTMMEKFK